MANMSYCRFRNTLVDLRDCLAALRYADGFTDVDSPEEREAAQQLYEMAGTFRAVYEQCLEEEAAADVLASDP
jgi:hypothetical protein